MEQNVFDVLKERGFIEQTTHEAEIRELLGKEKVTFYIGFDATADSLTAGHFLTIMAMMHMQRAGHRPIALLGGGTTMIVRQIRYAKYDDKRKDRLQCKAFP